MKPALIGFPFDENSSFMRGAAGAPPLIRDAFFSPASNQFSESGIDLGAKGALHDAGDKRPATADEMPAMVESSIEVLLRQGYLPLSLGGDHSITYPIMKAISRAWPGVAILHFDAHPDLYDEYDGNQFSHACPFARIMESGLAGRLVQVGIRTLNDHQREQAARFGVEVIAMKDWARTSKLTFDSPVYISVDVDCLDPACAPAVSHKEPGGATTRQVIEVIQQVNAPVVGADIVEFNPEAGAADVTAAVCAKLMKEILARMIENGSRRPE